MQEVILNNKVKDEFVNKLNNLIYKKKIENNFMDLVFLCIGTDRIIGDSFGPIVGSKIKNKLEKQNIFNINVYGTLEENVSYTNINKVEKIICNSHPKSCIIAIDSALSEKENIGKVYVSEGKIILGKGLNKKKIEIGDISIKAVVGKNYKIPQYNFRILQNISLNEVIKLADIVTEGLLEVIRYT